MDRDSDFSSSRSRRVATIVGQCAERLNAGETVDPDAVIARHPDLAPELGELLRTLLSVPQMRAQVHESIGGYEILREIGRGGMGVVYEARQASVDRRVALKVLAPGLLGDARARKRFEREASWTARVDHPGICTVYEAGADEGVQFIAMRFVEGTTLRRRIAAARDAHQAGDVDAPGLGSIEDRVRLVEKVARALHLAHEGGIVHRDVKPANIVVSDAGEPTIIDLGLAASLAEDVTQLTLSGPVGTPAYMAPEQLEEKGAPVDRRADVYALGVTLYEILTLEQPWTASTRYELYRRIIEDPPPDCRRVNPSISRELKIVIDSALAKRPDERYQSAEAFADEIRRVLEHRPIVAARPSLARRAGKWVRRNPLPTAFIVMLVVASTISLVLLAEARESARAARRSAYTANLAAFRLSFREGNVVEANERLDACPEELRGWEWRHFDLARDLSLLRFQAHAKVVRAVAFSPDGSRLATGGDDDAGPHDVRVWDLATGKRLLTLRGHREQVWSVMFSPDGETILSGSDDGSARVWSAATGELLATPVDGESGVRAVAFSPSGAEFATGDANGTIRLFHGATLEPARAPLDGEAELRTLAWHPDARRLITAHEDLRCRLWTLPDDPAVEPQQIVIASETLSPVLCAEFVLDGTRVQTGHRDGEVSTWSASDGAQMETANAHSFAVRDFANEPGSWLSVSSSLDRTLRIWRLGGWEPLATLPGHRTYVQCVAISSDGRTLASGAGSGAVRLWDAHARGGVVSRLDGSWVARFHPSADLIASAGMNAEGYTVELRRASTEERIGELEGLSAPAWSIVFSQDGTRLAAATMAEIHVWETATWTHLREIDGLALRYSNVALSVDGSRLAAGGAALQVWDLEGGGDAVTLDGHGRDVLCVAFTGDGRFLLSGGKDRNVRVWRTDTLEEERALPCDHWVFSVASSDDGRHIAAADDDEQVYVWDTRDWRRLRASGHDGRVRALDFSPDGARLASGSGDFSVRIWDVRTGEALATLRDHTDGVHSVDFDPSGRRLLSGAQWDGGLRIWESALPDLRGHWSRRRRAGVHELFRFAHNRMALIGGFALPSGRERRDERGEILHELVILPGSAGRHDVPAEAEFGGDPETDERLFQAVHEWGQRHGYVSAFPNFHWGVDVYGVVSLSTGHLVDVPLRDLHALAESGSEPPEDALSYLRLVSEWALRRDDPAAFPTFHRGEREDGPTLRVVILPEGVTRRWFSNRELWY